MVKSRHHDSTICWLVYPSHNARQWMVGVQLSFMVHGFAVLFPVIAVFYLLLPVAAALPPSSEKGRPTSRRIILSYITAFLACWLPSHAVLLVDTLSLLNLLPFSCRLENFLAMALQLTQCQSLLHQPRPLHLPQQELPLRPHEGLHLPLLQRLTGLLDRVLSVGRRHPPCEFTPRPDAETHQKVERDLYHSVQQ